MENSIQYRLDQSLFERMMYPCAQDIRPFPTSQLNIQRRMHPTIADLMRATLYPRLKVCSLQAVLPLYTLLHHSLLILHATGIYQHLPLLRLSFWAFSLTSFYLVQDGENTKKYPAVAGMADRLWWLDHKQPESRPDPRSEFATSYVNSFEVDMVHGLVQYLVNTNEYSFGDIAVLTPYNGQLAALNERLSSTCSIWLSKKDKDILDAMTTLPRDDWDMSDGEEPEGKTTFEMSSMLRLATIDNFQGEEAKIVILSTVRSNADEKVGFLKTPNRINVACSRAKHGFFIIGNASLMRNIGMWQAIIDLLRDKGKIGPSFHTCCSRHSTTKYEIHQPADFKTVPACTLACFSILDCGHLCRQKCHPRSLHDHMPCTDRCKKTLECGHKCDKLCGEPCGDCSQGLESVELACGHRHSLTCAESRLDHEPVCKAKIETVQLPCGHDAERFCNTRDEPLLCSERCSVKLQCGHLCSGACSDCQATKKHSTCTGTCRNTGDCGHQCPSPCHTGPCPPCKVRCTRECEHGKSTYVCSTIQRPCLKPSINSSGHPTLCCLSHESERYVGPRHQLLQCGYLGSSLADESCSNGCAQCLTGEIYGRPQKVLPCSHTVEVQNMDLKVLARTMPDDDVSVFDH